MFFLVDFPLHLCYTSLDNEEMNASEDPVLRSENPSSEPNGSEDSSDSEDFLNDVNDLRSEQVVSLYSSERLYSSKAYDLRSV